MTGKVQALLNYARSRIGAAKSAAAAAREIDADVAFPAPVSSTNGQPQRGKRRREGRGKGYRRQARDGVETYRCRANVWN